MTDGTEGAATATIEIVAEPSPLMLFTSGFRVSIAIDGDLIRLPPGTHAFAVGPGEHVIQVGLGYAFHSKATVTVNVGAGDTLRLRYVPRWIKNLRGRLVDERVPPARIVRR